jgi:hypothetical protein
MGLIIRPLKVRKAVDCAGDCVVLLEKAISFVFTLKVEILSVVRF